MGILKYILTIVFGLLSTPTLAQVGQIPSWPPNVNGTTGPPFVGMGDTRPSNIKGHWGMVAFKSSTRGQNMVNICDASSGGTCKDIATNSTTGLVSSTQNVGSIGACDNSSNQCYIEKLYDDSGALNCTGSVACPVAHQGSAGIRPKFVVNASGTLPGIGCGEDYFDQGTWTTVSQPLSALFSTSTTSDPGSFDDAVGSGSLVRNGIGAGLLPFAYAGAVLSAGSAISSGVFYSLISIINNTSSSIIVNGSATTGTAGTNNMSGNAQICHGDGVPSTLIVLEAAIYGADITSDVAALTTDMQTNGGF